MIINIETAKTKWCPMVKIESGYTKDEIKCIADECMLWIWKPYYNESTESGLISETVGYCGLVNHHIYP